MIIKTPQKYVSQPDALREAGKSIAEYSQNPLIVGSEKALGAAADKLRETCSEHHVSAENIHVFSGYPSEGQFAYYAELAKEANADAFLAVGGGRVLDTVKAAADLLGLPVITVPTIAATCAAWAGLTVQYDEEGSFVAMRPLKKAPELVIADTKIILSAPKRYLFAGVVDTFAKYYEIRPSLEHARESVNLEISFYASKVAFQKLEEKVFKAIYDAEHDIYGQAAVDVVDAIIYLAGFAGSFQTNAGYYSFAHPFYHVSTRFAGTRHRLHGEKVAYGILAQLYLENKPEASILEAMDTFEKYGNAFTLAEIGLDANRKEELRALARDVRSSFPYVEWPEEEIVDALLAADALVKQSRKKAKEDSL